MTGTLEVTARTMATAPMGRVTGDSEERFKVLEGIRRSLISLLNA